MGRHEKFNFPTQESLRNKIAAFGLDIALSDNLEILSRPMMVSLCSRSRR